MATEVVNKQRLVRIDAGRVARIADATLAELDHPNSNVTVAFVRDLTMRNLNSEFRGTDQATDVLSFPAQSGFADSIDRFDNDCPVSLGDVVVSTDTAQKQARAAGHSFQRELDELVIHGVIHLCGYDHQTDHGQMNRIELRVRKKLLDPK